MNAMPLPNPRPPARGKWFFLCAFTFSCFLFWWLPSTMFRLLVHMQDPIEDGALVTSVIAMALFAAGYLLPANSRPSSLLPEPVVRSCENFAYRATQLLFIPALPIALVLWYTHAGAARGFGGSIARPYQAVLYTHMFFGFMFVGSADPGQRNWRRIITAALLVIVPRLIVSLHGGRFFLAQAVVPALLIAIARGWIKLSVKRLFQIALLAVAIVFVPALTRGDDMSGPNGLVEFLANGSSLQLFQDNKDLNLNGRCPPLLVSMTAKTIPWAAMGECVLDFAGLKSLPATAGRIITDNDPGSFHGTEAGTGSNYLIELYLAGGLFGVLLGSALFGFSCRRFIAWIGRRSLFAGIWAECLTRALLAPRGELGYVFERIPSLVLATLFVVLLVLSAKLLQSEFAAGGAAVTPLASGAK
jgi:hypothetical protein